MRGCRDDSAAIGWEWEGETQRRCPLALLTPFTAKVLSLYSHYTAGFLPEAGGLNDQAAAYVRAIEVYRRASARAEDEWSRRTS